jgi:hypothetical protein
VKAVCVSNDPLFLAGHQQDQWSVFDGPHPLTPGKAYPVAAIVIGEHTLFFLTCDDYGLARLAPAGLFEPFRAKIPVGWKFRLEAGIRAERKALFYEPFVAAWGYREFVDSHFHRELLVKRDSAAMAVFQAEVERSGGVG